MILECVAATFLLTALLTLSLISVWRVSGLGLGSLSSARETCSVALFVNCC